MTVAQPATATSAAGADRQASEKVCQKNQGKDIDPTQEQWFAELLALPVGTAGQFDYSADLNTETTQAGNSAPLPQGWDMLCEKVDELATEPKNFDCTLLLPHLGEVQVSAQQTPHDWQIRLEFLQRQAFTQGCKAKRQLSQRLSEGLGKPVQLQILLRGEPFDG